jgi:NADH-quinone oxidoreductase subunit I
MSLWRKILLVDLLQGLWLTLRYAFTKPVTYQYPEQRRPIAPIYRGRQRLTVDDAGRLKCVACGLCAAACPSRCIFIEPAEREDGTRYPQVYEIEITRCVFCGYCAEVCPFDAVVLTTEHELATTNKRELIYDIAALREDGGK